MFTRVWFKDTLERTVSTWCQSFLGIVIAAGVSDLDIGTLQAAAVSALPAALAVLKAAIAARVPGTISPASLTEV